jgi:hypothetical protein
MKKALILGMVLLTIVLSSCGTQNTQIKNVSTGEPDYKKMYEDLLADQPPLVQKISFSDENGKPIESKDGWFSLGEKCKITIALKGHSTSVEMYITPTGTESYLQQKLIDIVPASNTIEYIWNVPKSTMGYFWVVAYNKEVGRKTTDLIKVIRE